MTDLGNAVVKVGIVDSGYRDYNASFVTDSAAFVLKDDALWMDDASLDTLGHGSKIVDVIHRLAPKAQIYMAQVFSERFTTTPAQVASAIDWLVEQDVQVINLSLGLRTDRDVLRDAVERAVAKGVLLCASSPAKGDPVYPSHYPGVLRTTGDARCAPEEWSLLGTQYADFGAHVRCLDGEISGASIGTAYICGHIAQFLIAQPEASRAALGKHLKSNASYFGAEQRTGVYRPEEEEW